MSFFVQVLLCPVPDVEYMHGITLNGEQNAEDIPPCAVEQLPDFLGKMPVFRGQRTARRQLFQGVDRVDNPRKPPGCRLGCLCMTVLIRGI